MENILHVRQGDWPAIESSSRPVLVDFWAQWCVPCHLFAPTFARLAEAYGDKITFAKVSVDEAPELIRQLEIRSIPTLLLLRKGKVLEELVGAQPYDELARILERHVMARVKK